MKKDELRNDILKKLKLVDKYLNEIESEEKKILLHASSGQIRFQNIMKTYSDLIKLLIQLDNNNENEEIITRFIDKVKIITS